MSLLMLEKSEWGPYDSRRKEICLNKINADYRNLPELASRTTVPDLFATLNFLPLLMNGLSSLDRT